MASCVVMGGTRDATHRRKQDADRECRGCVDPGLLLRERQRARPSHHPRSRPPRRGGETGTHAACGLPRNCATPRAQPKNIPGTTPRAHKEPRNHAQTNTDQHISLLRIDLFCPPQFGEQCKFCKQRGTLRHINSPALSQVRLRFRLVVLLHSVSRLSRWVMCKIVAHVKEPQVVQSNPEYGPEYVLIALA